MQLQHLRGDMSQSLDLIQPGDILVTSQKGFRPLSLPIRFANFCRRGYADRIWTHTAVYVGNGEVVEAFPTGIIMRSVEDAYLNNDYEYLILRRKTAASNVDFSKAIDFCRAKVGYKYDNKALAYFALMNIAPPTLRWIIDNPIVDKALNTEDAYFCSELAGTALLEANEYCFDRPPQQVMPVDFKNSYCFEVVKDTTAGKKDGFLKKSILSLLYFVGTMLWWMVFVLILLGLAVGVLLLLGFQFRVERKNINSHEKDKTKNPHIGDNQQ